MKHTCVIVGAGHRAMAYAAYSREHPDRMEVVGVADPSPLRRNRAVLEFGIDPTRVFNSADELAAVPKFADFAINGTMDHHHVPTSLPLLRRGYHLLLEKPFATNEKEMNELARVARAADRKVVICHVLRHTPFYTAIRREVVSGTIGEIININAVEHVSYHHMAVGFIRGKWNRDDVCGSTMLMSKSCHDLDLITWMKSGIAPQRVSSFGSNQQFDPSNAPEGAGTRCLIDCSIEADCRYSARKLHLDHPKRWAMYAWSGLEHLTEPTLEEMTESLKTSPYGRCVWKTDMNVVDHQSVLIEFVDGATATLNMIGGSAKPSRSLHLIGTRGEIQGCMEDATYVVRHIDNRPGKEYCERVVDLNLTGDTTGVQGGHGGGDERLVGDFLDYLDGRTPSLSTTNLEDSIAGHLIGFCADRSNRENRVITIDSMDANSPNIC